MSVLSKFATFDTRRNQTYQVTNFKRCDQGKEEVDVCPNVESSSGIHLVAKNCGLPKGAIGTSATGNLTGVTQNAFFPSEALG